MPRLEVPESLSLLYPGTSIVFDMSLTYILVALAAVLLNNVVVERLNLHTRITTGIHSYPVLSPPRGSKRLRAHGTCPPSFLALSVKHMLFPYF